MHVKDVSAPAALGIESAFITGAAGFIGRALGERLRSLGVAVRGVDVLAGEPGVIAGDVCAPQQWQAAVKGCEVVFHTAAVVSNAANPLDAWRLNVFGTRCAVDAAVAAGAKRFVHFSSVRAFGDTGFPDGVEERHPVRPDGNPYVDTKIASEQVVLQAHAAGEISCTVVRPGDVYGPGSRPWTILPVEAIKARRFLLPAMGQGVFSPVYVDNLLDGVIAATSGVEAEGQVFTLTDGAGVTCGEFFGHYSRMLGRRPPPALPTPLALAAAALPESFARLTGRATESNRATVRYLARTGTYSIEKARRLLDYEPQVSLEEGMERTRHWLGERGLITRSANSA